MLVRNRMKLDQEGMIPPFMRDAWKMKHGDTYPTEETPGMERLVRFDAWVSWLLTPLVKPLFVLSIFCVAPIILVQGWSEDLLRLSIVLCVMVATVKMLPILVTYVVQFNTKSNTFNHKLGNALRWMEIKPQDMGRFSATELTKRADEALVKQAQRILRLEDLVRGINGYGGDEGLKALREEMRTKSEVFGELGLTNTPWEPIFRIANERNEEEKKEKAKKIGK